jgi:uncharacterized membrane protein
MKAFLRHTFLGGLFVVLPVTLILIVLARAVAWIRAAMEPFATVLPFETLAPGLWAVLALILLSFIAGLLMQIPPVRDWAAARRERLAERFPFFRFLRGFEESLLDETGNKPLKAALAEIEEALVPAFVMEELADGRYVVFVPAVPSAFQGAVYILARERVHLIDASVRQVTKCVSRWGVGAGELVRTMRKSA